MNLVRDTNPGAYAVYVSCYKCGHRDLLANMVADLDGSSFKAYYCISGHDVSCYGCMPNGVQS